MNRLGAAVVMLTMVGTCAAGVEGLPELENTEWHLSRLSDPAGVSQPPPAAVKVSLQLFEGRVSGNAGCNTYFGEYTLGPEGELSFSSALGATMMACAPPASEFEPVYLGLLASVAAYRLQGNALSLLDGQGETLLQFTPDWPLGLEHTQWRAAGINNGRGGVVSSRTTGLTNALFAEGTVSGSAGCNRFQAAYRVSGDRITIEQPAASRKYCNEPDGIMAQEQQFLDSLSRAATFAVRSGRLELRDDGGALQVSFTSRP